MPTSTFSARYSLTLLLAAAVASAAAAQETPPRGELLYRVHCESCHGKKAKGNGPVAPELRSKPTDLTKLTRKGEDGFPTDWVYQVIDGRESVRAHGTSEMPVWGFSFQDPGRVDDQEEEVRSRILALVSYLRSLQRKR